MRIKLPGVRNPISTLLLSYGIVVSQLSKWVLVQNNEDHWESILVEKRCSRHIEEDAQRKRLCLPSLTEYAP